MSDIEEILTAWFERHLDHDHYTGWTDDDFARELATHLRENGLLREPSPSLSPVAQVMSDPHKDTFTSTPAAAADFERQHSDRHDNYNPADNRPSWDEVQP